MSATTTPDWLTARGGELRRGIDDSTWFVLLNGTPIYRNVAAPAGGRFTAVVTQTNNGKRLGKDTTFATADEALRGGLAQLREALGW